MQGSTTQLGNIGRFHFVMFLVGTWCAQDENVLCSRLVLNGMQPVFRVGVRAHIDKWYHTGILIIPWLSQVGSVGVPNLNSWCFCLGVLQVCQLFWRFPTAWVVVFQGVGGVYSLKGRRVSLGCLLCSM